MEISEPIRSLYSLRAILPKNSLEKLYLFSIARIVSNLLDLVGVAGVATLALAIDSLIASDTAESVIDLPLLGELVIDENQLLLLATITIGIFLAKSLISIFLRLKTSMFVASLESHLSARLAADFFSKEIQSDHGIQESLSEFQNTAIASMEAVSLFINSRISLISEATLLISILGVFLYVNPVATLATTAFMLIVLGILKMLVTSRIKQRGIKVMFGSKLSLLHSKELFGIRKEARVSGALPDWIEKFRQSRQTSARGSAAISTLKSAPRYVIESSLLIGLFAFLGVVYLSGDIRSQALTLGVFMAGGLRLAALLVPLQASMNQMTEGASRGRFALHKLMSIDNSHNTSPAFVQVRTGDEPLSLTLENVSFGFSSESLLLQQIWLEVAAGSKVSLVGPSGAGKSTLLEIAAGFRIPRTGSVKLDQTDASLLLEKGTGEIGFVPQRSHLVSGSLASNVSLEPHHETDLVRVSELLKMLGLDEFSSSDMLEMPIEPDAGSLSGGEIQRVGLARALYRDPRILFLDESTSSLDANTEAIVNNALEKLRGKVTIVLVAHRLSSVKNSDLIMYLDSGKIIASGTFSELMEKVEDFRTAAAHMGLN
jgi:ATP-binding cassette subfamily C protein